MSSMINAAYLNTMRMTPRILPATTHSHRYFADNKDSEFKSQDENPHLYDPTYIPCEEADFDVDPLDVRLRQPLPKEVFLPRDEVLKRMVAICEGMERCTTDGKIITEDSHLQNDLGLDSLDQVEFGLAVEDEFDIEIPDEDAEQIVTLGDAVELIADHPHGSCKIINFLLNACNVVTAACFHFEGRLRREYN